MAQRFCHDTGGDPGRIRFWTLHAMSKSSGAVCIRLGWSAHQLHESEWCTSYICLRSARSTASTHDDCRGRRTARTSDHNHHLAATLPQRTQITYADRTAAYQYDGQGRKTQQTVTAGSVSRTAQYAYNAQGLLSQVDGPRTDVSDVTSYGH